ncbi:YSC84-related protein [Maridesulfovibrio ferrireducens]|uniref:YSC84-related protein n=1 Tax=Maridesulfovibrio ferrireducens TaxID=246191 RepID=UPI0026EBBD13|nr:YSC84-related protein [Maridesulfovibrio ferrireducens]
MFPLVYQAGAFFGFSYRTGSLMVGKESNKAYYGKPISVKELLMTHEHDKPEADVLFNVLMGI